MSAPVLFRKKWFYVLLLIGACIWAAFHFTGDKKPEKQQNPIAVTLASAVRKDMPVEVALVGTVVPYESVAVKSRVDSQVVKVAFRDGETVKEGQLLFKLDDRTFAAQVRSAEATAENARTQYERYRALLEKQAIAKAQLDEAKAAYDSAQAALENARVLLHYTTITAPISGRAGTINVTRGNNAKANDAEPLVVINQIQPVRVQFAIAQRYYAPMRAAMSDEAGLSVLAEHGGGQAEGTLEYIDNAIDTTNGTFAARAKFENKDEALWPGMFVNVTLRLGMESGVLTVPAVAIQGDEGSRFVFVAESGKAVKKPVTISRLESDTAIIADGISEGEQVVTDGLLKLTDGAAISVAQPEAAQ